MARQRVVDEVDRSLHDALMVVKDVVEKPSIVAGGGSPEAYLSTELNEWAGSYDGREQLAMKQYAEAFEINSINNSRKRRNGSNRHNYRTTCKSKQW